MGKNSVVWGIDIGNTSLKALRCRIGSEPGTVEVLGFDYIEHSKILSQPGADANAILAETLSLFLSRNNVKGEKIAVSLSGQNTLWRFQPLPPIDPRKISDLIRYEVKQWLPFDLSEVIWDYRQVGGIYEGGIALDLNIFMYAIKRELAFRTVEQYAKDGLDVDCLQGAQLALYNGFVHDHYDNYDVLAEQPLDEMNDYDVLLNVGTDTTEVVITNGVSVWLRNIPIGGNLFTKALTKTLKLTFSNAEHIKRNTAASQDPKAVILAMKPVFNDMLSDVDRSIKYYCSLNKKAKIRKIYAYGNAMKLPGLRQFLAKSNGIDVEFVTQYKNMQGQEVLANPQFTDNASSFGVAYGLAVQLLKQAPLDINLIPKEVVKTRLINSKKPWALAACALLLLGLTIQYFASINAFSYVDNTNIESAYKGAEQVAQKSKKLIDQAKDEAGKFKAVDQIGRNLTSNVEGRLTWLELIKAVNSVIPTETIDPNILKEGTPPALKREAIERQRRIYVKNIEVQREINLADWYKLAKKWYYIDEDESKVFEEDSKVTPEVYWYYPPETTTTGESGKLGGSKTGSSKTGSSSSSSRPGSSSSSSTMPGSSSGSSTGSASKSSSSTSKSSSTASKTGKAGASSGPALTEFDENVDPRLEKIPGPTGGGNIVQLTGYHYHNSDDVDNPERGAEYVRRTILWNLKHNSVELPISLERQRAGESGTDIVTLKELGIYYPILINPGVIDEKYRLLDPEAVQKKREAIMEQQLKNRPNRSGGASVGGGMTGSSSPGGMGGPGAMGGMGGSMGSGGMGGGGMGGGRSMTGGGRGMPGLDSIAGDLNKEQILNLRRFEFIIQFVWQETPPSVRDMRKKTAAEAKAKAEATASAGPGTARGSAATGGTAPGRPTGSPAGMATDSSTTGSSIPSAASMSGEVTTDSAATAGNVAPAEESATVPAVESTPTSNEEEISVDTSSTEAP